MIPQTYNPLLAAILAASSVYASPCKPSLGSSSIVSFSSTVSDSESWSTTAPSTIGTSTATDAQSFAETSTDTEMYSLTEATTTTVFETSIAATTATAAFETSVAETTTTAEATTTAPVNVPCQPCRQVVPKSNWPSSCGRQVAPWQVADTSLIGVLENQGLPQCANACSNDCLCKSFSFYGGSCYLYNGDESEMQLDNFYLGPYYYDMTSCYDCYAGEN